MEKEKILKEKYRVLAKKYKFPDYDKFNNELELIALDPKKCGIFLNALVRIMYGKLQQFLGFIDPFLAPQPTSTYTFVVFKGLTDKKRKELLKYYKEMMILYQQGMAVMLKDDNAKAQYINKVWKAYPGFKNKMLNVLEDLNEIFLKEEAKAERRGYMG